MRTALLPVALCLAAAAAGWLLGRPAAPPRPTTPLCFEVTVAKGLLPKPTDGRLLIVLARQKKPEPRRTIGEVRLDAPPVLGANVDGLKGGGKAVVGAEAATFPIPHL